MQKPKAILFDYGETLLHENDMDAVRGERALIPYITENPHGHTAEDIQNTFDRLFFDALKPARECGAELHEFQLQRTVNEVLGLRFSVSHGEQEKIFWDAACTGGVMPGVPELLEYLHGANIRTGVISNIGFSGAALKDRIDRLLPQHHFEFIMASSEYGVRKPSPWLFAIAAEKLGLLPRDIWFCGDNFKADVLGAAAAGMQPVLYICRDMEHRWGNGGAGATDEVEYLSVYYWRELTEILEELQ